MENTKKIMLGLVSKPKKSKRTGFRCFVVQFLFFLSGKESEMGRQNSLEKQFMLNFEFGESFAFSNTLVTLPLTIKGFNSFFTFYRFEFIGCLGAKSHKTVNFGSLCCKNLKNASKYLETIKNNSVNIKVDIPNNLTN